MAATGWPLASTSRVGAAPGIALHPGAWLTWLACGSAAVVLTSNPLYLSLAFIASMGVYLSVRDTPKGRALQLFVLIGVALALLTVPLNVLTGSSGSTALVTVVEVRSPDWFGGVVFGGDVTAEALVAATSRALSIATLVLLAASFNASVDHFRLLRLAPPSLARVMLVLTIALLVVPQAIARAKAVADAQRLRGRRLRDVRSTAQLLLPTLQGALEQSIQRAESMDARGFGGGSGAGNGRVALVGAAGVGLCAWGAFAHYYYGVSSWPAVLMLGGVALVAVTLLRDGGARASRYQREHWTPVDMAIGTLPLLGIAIVVAMRVAGAGEPTYIAFPAVSAPAFHPLGALAFALLLAPALPPLLSQAGPQPTP